MKTVAIIGAGLSGLTLANALSPIANVTVFEKSRGVGGRMSTRRAAPYEFDHGAQYFTAKSREFMAFIEGYARSGVTHEWPIPFEEIEHHRNQSGTRYVGGHSE